MSASSQRSLTQVAGKRVTVAGLGRFGGQIALARWLVGQGARVLVTDRDPADELQDSVAQLSGLPIEFCLGEHRDQHFSDTDLVVASPAIPLNNRYLEIARKAGVPITTEIRLFVERCPARRVVGVTGTKGKSTTTALLGRMLEQRHRTHVGGNIGRSLLPELAAIGEEDVVVLELSSYMLEHLRVDRWSPHIAVVGMITLDHVEWHGSAEAYVDAKRNIVRFQKPDDWAVLSKENEASRSFAKDTSARVVSFGIADPTRLFELTLPGRHNQLNAQAAFAAASQLGVSWDEAQQTVRDFPGLPHRLQLVHHDANGVRWFNDSIATIPEAAVAAVDSFPTGSVVQIVGGSDKGLSIDVMCDQLRSRAKAIICIGATGPHVYRQLGLDNGTTAAPRHLCADLPAAVTLARSIAARGDVVLLSPGFASYDQFANFQERGDLFTKLAQA